MDAAARWARVRSGRVDRSKATVVDDDMQKQFRELGVTIAIPVGDEEMFGIMPTAWNSFCAFLECQTQWNAVSGMSGLIWLGLNYQSCEVVLGARRHSGHRRRPTSKIPPKLLDDLRVMEAAALRVLNEAD
ncbi:DUF1799 domain-containing protein [Rhizobium sp. NFR12]|uniref:DUF1799 domain-containing protein n=1 Tax=Rhizobium sp. NFR12 TaxID=1566261 RepID=UPI0008A77BE3|nr:DUF1799 domain-containing protein [Rhizobium sp. NFR12]SEH22527.1 Phage related hypothetical protein [Rhizobium sp. NFR12]